MKKILLFVWQLPQMLLGAVLVKVLKAGKRVTAVEVGGRRIAYWHFKRNTKFSQFISGVSLACFILLSDNNNNETTIRHEYGHSIQSKYLGWFYLPVIGIYSAVFCNLWDRWFHKHWPHDKRMKWYYSRWCEAWADKLGGVVRNFE
jgi:hypothetical protein